MGPEKPRWSAALIAGIATVGGASSVWKSALYTAGFVTTALVIWLPLKLLGVL